MITLQNESTRLELLPELGGGIASWVALDSDQPLLQSPVDNKHTPYSWGKLACFPLVPWSNRIGQGGYETAQGWLHLSCFQEDEPYPIHGTAWHQPWEVASRSAEEAVLRLASQDPYPYKAEQKFILAGERLILELTVEHLDHHPAWYGIGLHPFFLAGKTRVFRPVPRPSGSRRTSACHASNGLSRATGVSPMATPCRRA
ncbi:hypothetical protein ACE0DR_22275 [Azotobacter sp. CWF10]